MGTQSSLWRPGACNMLALAVVSLLVCANGSRLPASSEQVMPKLHLAYLVEDVEYPRPEELQASNEELPHSSRVKRQESSSQAVNSQLEAREEAERLETEEADAETFSTASTTSGRNAALSAAILRVLEVANAKPTPVDPTGSYSGRRRRSAQLEPVQSNDAETFATASATPGRNAALSAAILKVLEVANANPTPVDPVDSGRRRRKVQLAPVHSNAHQYGLLEPKVELVKVKSHGNYGKVVQASVVAPSAHAKLEHGKRRKRSENFDNFVPFSVYDDRRVKLLKVEENDFHALPRVIASNKQKRADLEKVEEAKVHVVQLTADQ